MSKLNEQAREYILKNGYYGATLVLRKGEKGNTLLSEVLTDFATQVLEEKDKEIELGLEVSNGLFETARQNAIDRDKYKTQIQNLKAELADSENELSMVNLTYKSVVKNRDDLKAEVENLKKDLKFETGIADGQVKLNKELTSEVEKLIENRDANAKTIGSQWKTIEELKSEIAEQKEKFILKAQKATVKRRTTQHALQHANQRKKELEEAAQKVLSQETGMFTDAMDELEQLLTKTKEE